MKTFLNYNTSSIGKLQTTLSYNYHNTIYHIKQGHCPAEFSSNPDQMFLVILKTLKTADCLFTVPSVYIHLQYRTLAVICKTSQCTFTRIDCVQLNLHLYSPVNSAYSNNHLYIIFIVHICKILLIVIFISILFNNTYTELGCVIRKTYTRPTALF